MIFKTFTGVCNNHILNIFNIFLLQKLDNLYLVYIYFYTGVTLNLYNFLLLIFYYL